MFLTIFLHNEKNPIFKDPDKFQVNMPIINAIVIAVQSLENLHTFVIWQPCWWAKNAHQPIFPYNIIENSETSLTHNSVSISPNDLKFGGKTHCVVL